MRASPNRPVPSNSIDPGSGVAGLDLTEALNGVTLDGFDGAWAPDASYVLFTASARRQERRQWKGLTYDSVTKVMQR